MNPEQLGKVVDGVLRDFEKVNAPGGAALANLHPELVATMARDFSEILLVWIGSGRMAEVVRRNRDEKHPGVCHSHDFCDANMAMLAVFEKHQIPCDSAAEDAAMWNRVWNMAKAAEFCPTAIDKAEEGKSNV